MKAHSGRFLAKGSPVAGALACVTLLAPLVGGFMKKILSILSAAVLLGSFALSPAFAMDKSNGMQGGSMKQEGGMMKDDGAKKGSDMGQSSGMGKEGEMGKGNEKKPGMNGTMKKDTMKQDKSMDTM